MCAESDVMSVSDDTGTSPVAVEGDNSSAAEDADQDLTIEDDCDLSDDPGPSFPCHFMEVFSPPKIGLTVEQLNMLCWLL